MSAVPRTAESSYKKQYEGIDRYVRAIAAPISPCCDRVCVVCVAVASSDIRNDRCFDNHHVDTKEI